MAEHLQQLIFHGFDRPDVEVFWEGEWCSGELRMWTQHGDGSWSGNVVFRAPDGTRSQTFPESDIRLDEVDRAAGR